MIRCTNTHAALFRAYDRCIEKIKVLELDGESLLEDITGDPTDESNYQWLSIINRDLKKEYKLKTKIMDDINELDLYDIEYK